MFQDESRFGRLSLAANSGWHHRGQQVVPRRRARCRQWASRRRAPQNGAVPMTSTGTEPRDHSHSRMSHPCRALDWGGDRFPRGAAPGWYVLPFQGSRPPGREAASRPPADRPVPARTDAPSTGRPHSPWPTASTGRGPAGNQAPSRVSVPGCGSPRPSPTGRHDGVVGSGRERLTTFRARRRRLGLHRGAASCHRARPDIYCSNEHYTEVQTWSKP
jgi:hypothetical protein